MDRRLRRVLIRRLDEFQQLDAWMRSNRGLRVGPSFEVRHLGGHRSGKTWVAQPRLPLVEDDPLDYEVVDSLVRLPGTGGRVTRFHRRKMNYKATYGGQSAKADDTDDSTWAVRRRSVDELLVDFLASSRWHTEKAGSTGGDLGRPRRGIVDPELIAEQFAQAAIEVGGRPMLLRAEVSRRGKPSVGRKQTRELVAEVVARLLARPRPVNAAALACWLGCNPSTVYSLRTRGEKRLEESNPRRLDSVPWCYRPAGVLKCSRGHFAYTPSPELWIGSECGHDHACKEALHPPTPKANEIPLRGEEHMIATDDQLAADAERVAEAAQDLFEIATRLQARFPTSCVLATTVDRFLEAALDAGHEFPQAA
jgi:hypothetical protein